MRILFFILFLTGSMFVKANVFSIANDSTKMNPWSSNGVFSLGIGQTSFTNWLAGGDNNVNISGRLVYNLNYKKDIVNWNTNFDSKYGTMIFFGKRPHKTNDQIHMSSKLGYEIDSSWSFSLLFNFDSQFTNGYLYPNDSIPISRFMAPGYLMLGVGADFKPNKHLSVFLSPISNKITIVNDYDLANKGSFGVKAAQIDDSGRVVIPGRRFKNEPGGYVKIQYENGIGDVFKFTTRLEFFSAYAKETNKIDVRWNVNALYRFSKRAAVTFTLDLIYDEDAIFKEDINGDGLVEEVGPRTQVNESLALGMTMNW